MPFNVIDAATGETKYGLTTYSYKELLKMLNDSVIAKVLAADPDASVDTSETSPVGLLNAIVAQRFADLWENLSDVEKSFYLSTVFGQSTDKLAYQVGFSRSQGTVSSGELRFIGDDGTLVPKLTSFESLRADEFQNPEDVLITLSSCLKFRITVGVAKTGKVYSIRIGDLLHTITSTSDDPFTILTDLQTEMSSDTSITMSISSDLGEDSYLDVSKVDDTVPMAVIVSSLLLPSFIEVEAPVIAVELGEVFGDADTVVNILNTVSGLESVYNPKDFLLGSLQETDEELKERVATDFRTLGSDTADTIQAILEKLFNVRAAIVDENRTFETSPEGVPPKSYEVIISHDTDEESIARAIWLSKPSGISTHGNNSYSFDNASGDEITVYYTNADEKYMYVKVDYTRLLDEEEVFPEKTGEFTMKETITSQGLKYAIGQDIFGQQFIPNIYDAVEGIDDIDVQVFVSDNPDLDVNTISGWVDHVSITRTQVSTFATNRILTNDNT